MANFGISIRCTEGQASRLANEIRQMGYSAKVNFDIGKRYEGEKPLPAHWELATVVVRGFEGEEDLEQFINSFGIKRKGRAHGLYQLKESI